MVFLQFDFIAVCLQYTVIVTFNIVFYSLKQSFFALGKDDGLNCLNSWSFLDILSGSWRPSWRRSQHNLPRDGT